MVMIPNTKQNISLTSLDDSNEYYIHSAGYCFRNTLLVVVLFRHQ